MEAAGIAVELLDWSGLQKSDLKRFHAIVFPGGYSGFQRLSAGHRGLDAVRRYVEGGGRYLGIGAGGYLAATEVHWEEKHYPYPLALFDGVAEGSINEIAAWPEVGRAELSVTDDGRETGLTAAHGEPAFYRGGCRFVGGTNVSVLANYSDGSPAIIKRPYGVGGKGAVILSGVHFERPAPEADGEVSESDPPPVLSTVLLPRLLGIEPETGFEPISDFDHQKHAPTVNADTDEEEWIALQRSLRKQLHELRAAANQPTEK